MNKIIYRVFYDFNESIQSNPAHSQLSAEEIARALQDFPARVEASLIDFDASVNYESPAKDADSIIAVIESNATEDQVSTAVAACLSELNLSVAKLQRV